MSTRFDDDLFNVYQFFEDGSCEQVRCSVTANEAVTAAKHYCTSIAAQCGVTRRVIVTDDGDHTNFLWEYGRGIVYPTAAMMKEYREQKETE